MEKRTLVTFGIVNVNFAGASLFLSANYYSTVADIREMLVNVDDEYGETLFETRDCVFCHALSNAGSTATIGSVPHGVGARAYADHIRESIVDLNRMIVTNCDGSECQSGVMPQYGGMLDDVQVSALATYLAA